MRRKIVKFLKDVFVVAAGFALAGPVVFFTASIASAATNITSTYPNYYGWNDVVGWLDFYNTLNINVASKATTTGWASSSAGDFSLDCATARGGSVCGSSPYGVYNPGNGNLTGWAWNDTYGWVSFDCHNNNGCGSSYYEVLIDPTSGDFSGATDFAWNDAIGWISFNCNDSGGCLSSNFKVNTDWRSTSTSGYVDSSTFDTGVNGGAELNSIVFQGPTLPSGTSVRFQIAASSTPNGPWNFVGYDGTANTYYPKTGTSGTPGVSIPLDYVMHNNQRYFRYKVILVSNAAQTLTPTVNSVTVNWSP